MHIDQRQLARRALAEISVSLFRFSLAFVPPLWIAYLIVTEEEDIRLGAFATGAAWFGLFLVWVFLIYWSSTRIARKRDDGITLGEKRRPRRW